jgi:carbon-monoxide dehydrogenase medium subunit
MSRFDYHQPSTLSEVLELLERYGQDARIVAGGTALFVDMEYGRLAPEHLIALDHVPELNTISENDDVRIGAMATLTEIANFAGERDDLRGLVDAIWLIGAKQIQNVATAGGNICGASQAADMIPPLLCLDTQLRLHGRDGERVVALDGFLTGFDQNDLQPSEILVEIILPSRPPRTGTAFHKKMRRQARDLSLAAAAARVTLADDNQTCEDIRIALCAVAPIPFRARAAEDVLRGSPLDPVRVKEAAQAAAAESSPISDMRASAEYRRLLVETLVERAVFRAAERATNGESV